MQSDDPPFLCLGTEVSAKFKGAFCEAKVKKLVKNIRCKVNLGSEHGTVLFEDKEIKGTIVMNGVVDVMHGKILRSGTIQHIKDCSQYSVVFNDGDERNLRRSQMCLKSGRHFEPEVSLDSLPLYNPEHFSNPVVHGNKKRNRQLSVERTPRKRKAKDDEEEEEDDPEKRKKRRAAANVAVAAIADQGESETEEEREVTVDGGEEKEKEMSEKKKQVKTPEASPAKKRKEEKEAEKKKEKKDDDKKKKDKEEKKKDTKEEVKRKDKKEKDEDKKKEKDEDKKKERKVKEKEHEKEEKKSRTEEKEKSKDTSPRKERERPASSSSSLKDRGQVEEEVKKPGVAVSVAVHKDSGTIYYPAVTTSQEAYRRYATPGSLKTVSDAQITVKSFCSDAYVRVNISNVVLFESFDISEFFKGKMGNKSKAAIGLATAWNQKKKLPKEWTLAEIYGDEEIKRMEKDKLKRIREEEKRKEKEEEKKKEEERKRKEEEKRLEEEERKKKEEEERKKKDEEERKKKEKEEERKEKEREKERKEREREKEKEKEKEKERKEKEREREKEKEKKTKKQVEPESSESESESSEDDEADNQERDIFTAQLYKFHEERNTPINKAPVWGGKDLDLHNLYRYVRRYGGAKKCTDSGLWKKILIKLKLEGSGAQPVNVRKAYSRYLDEFHSTYSQLGWSLNDLSTKIVSGGRSAKKVIDYGFRKKRRERKDKGLTKLGDKDESIRSEETAENDEERDEKVKKEEEESIRPTDASSTETLSRRSLSRITNSESPMPSSSTITPAKRGKRGGKGSKEESVVRTMSECTEPAIAPVGGEDALSTVSSSAAGPFPPSAASSPTLGGVGGLEGTSWAHAEVNTEGDNFLPANILSHFYQGMSVRALHSGRWYAARVVQVQQPSIKVVTEAIDRATGGGVKREPGESFGFTSIDELREMSKKVRCLVHYLGWNSRYDEHMRLPQIRISPKDDESSMKLARSKLNEDLLGWVARWSRTREGMTALCGPLLDAASPRDSSTAMGGMGGYRPRRVSFSQYEQLSNCATSPMGGAASPSMSERERRERRSEEKGEKMKSEEREEKEEEEEEESRKSMTPVIEKKEKRKISKKEEREKKEDERREEKEEEKHEKVKHPEKKERKEKEKEESKPRRIRAPARTPSPSKLSSLAHSTSVDAAPAASSVPSAADATTAAATLTPPTSAAAAATSSSSATEEKERGEKKGCSISETIDEVVLLLGSRAEKEKKEREERERKERKEAEKARKEEEAAAALVAKVAAKQKNDEIVAGPSTKEEEEEEEEDEGDVDVEKNKEEERPKKDKEVRFEKKERKKGGKDREKEEEVKGKKKVKEDEKPKEDKKRASKRVPKKEEEEDEEMDEEEEEFERLHKEAQDLGVLLPDLPLDNSEMEEEKKEEEEMDRVVTSSQDNDERYQSDSSMQTISTTIDKSAPPSSAKGKKRKKKPNQSNMVLDRKYAKKGKKEDEEETDEEDAVYSERPPHASLSVLKTRMLKAMEADGSLGDFSPIGLPHITNSNLYGEKVVCNWQLLEKHAEELREYYYGVRAELAKLEKRNKATIKRRIEKDRAEREVRKAAKEAAAASIDAAPSTSAAVAALNAEI